MLKACAFVALLLFAGSAVAADAVFVDRENKRAAVILALRGGELVVSLDPLSSLIVHTATLYQMNRQPGVQSYPVRRDPAAMGCVEPALLDLLAAKETNLSPSMKQGFHPAMLEAASRGAYTSLPDALTLSELAQGPFGRALVSMWDCFYHQYWERSFDELLVQFRRMNDEVRWAESLAQMERLTRRQWKGSAFVFATEGAGRSALWVKPNICIGGLGEASDAGFVHEGLHLLLGEEWATAPRIQAFMASRDFNDRFWKSNWAGKYEQALVASLDIYIRGLHRKYPEGKVVPNYLSGVRVGDIADIAWPLVKDYADHPAGTIEDLMLEMIQRGEGPTRPTTVRP
jgi:hypothetical protein